MSRRPIIAIFGISFLISLILGSYLTLLQNQKTLEALAVKPSQPQVLGMSGGGRGNRASQMYVYGGDNYSGGSGGVISMSSKDQPSIYLSSYNVAGQADIAVYRSSIDAVLKYLTHDSENKQLNKNVDTSSFELLGTTTHNIQSGDQQNILPLPIDGKGIWYVTIKLPNILVDGFIIRSDNGIIAKEGNNKLIFWGQNFDSYKSVGGGNLKLYALKDNVKELQSVSFDDRGMAESDMSIDNDLAIYTQGDDVALLPLNLQYLNTGYVYSQFLKTVIQSRYFIFTDRPLYQPGDTVNFKAIIRKDDDARYSIPSGEAKVTISTGNDETKFEKSYPISEDGSINGKYELPKDAPVGDYSLIIDRQEKYQFVWGEYSSNSLHFNVQNYQKPESFINLDTPQIEYISGDKAKLEISGSYFSGQPLLGTEIKYKVTAVDYYEYNYYSDQERSAKQSIDTFYGLWYGSQTVAEGNVTLDKTGRAVVEIDTKQLENSEENYGYTKGKSKIFVAEATQLDGSLVPSYSKKNFIVYAGEYGIYQTSSSSSGKINQTYKLPLKLAPYFRTTSLTNVALTARINRETWVKDQVQDAKYPTYHKEEEDLGSYDLKTSKDGTTFIAFTPSRLGYYKINVEGKDRLDNYIAKQFYTYISDGDIPIYTGENSPSISLTLDKDKYDPTDKAVVTIVSEIPDRDILLTLERGRLDRSQIVHMSGKSSDVELPLQASDVPNMYLTVSSFNGYGLDISEINLPVSADGKKLVVTISPNSAKYGPSDSVSVDLSTTDRDGNPQQAEVALWAVDKAIYELADTNLFSIFDTFWAQRSDTTADSDSLKGIMTQQSEGGGCFASDTQITMANGATNSIATLKPGDSILTRTSDNSKIVKVKVTSIHKATVAGYMIVNQTLRLTPDHILRLNGKWQTAGDIQIGDKLTGQSGQDIEVETLEWQLGKFDVYNLEVKDYHTFIADGIWVHNQKGYARSTFKDTAYWNPLIKTDKNGKASIKFKLPDNLTTWTLVSVASTKDSAVGQNTKEIMVTKDIIVRPILPNIMRVKDELYLSALVQNFTDQDHKFEVQLSFDSGKVKQNTWEGVNIASMSMEQLDWKITPDKINDAAKLKITATAIDNSKLSDSIEVTIPVRLFGFLETVGETAIGDKTYPLKLAKEIDLDQSITKLSLAPSLFGTLPTVMDYLVDYGYGCVEQTVSRLVPSIIVAENPDLFDTSIKDKNLDKIVDKTIARLKTMQRGDGGWTWWFTGKSDPYITAYVIEYLGKAESLGYQLPGNMLSLAENYLKNQKQSESSVPLDQLDPDLLSLAVINNYKNGDHNPSTNGLKILTSLAQSQGDAYFWAAGPKERFGSVEASTGMALSAILTAGGDKNIADKAVLYLTRSRKSNYWANTYATSRIISALVDYAKSSRDLAPNYEYQITQDGKKLSSGKVADPRMLIKDIEIDITKLKNNSEINVSKTGEGNLYSTLLTSEFLTSKEQERISRGISISKRFENAKGADLALGVGDTVNVYLTISGLASDDKYGVMTDELPSGMVPVNTNLKNEQGSWNIPEDFEYGFNITDTEVTENGVVLSLYNISSEEHTYSYKARVVSAGKFNVPPATVSLMYAPEIYGRSATSQIEIQKISGAQSDTFTNKIIWSVKTIIIGVSLLIAVIGIIIFVKKRRTSPLPPNET